MWSSVVSPLLCSKPRAGHSIIKLGCSIQTDAEKQKQDENAHLICCPLLVFGGSDCSGAFYNDTVRCTVEIPTDKWWTYFGIHTVIESVFLIFLHSGEAVICADYVPEKWQHLQVCLTCFCLSMLCFLYWCFYCCISLLLGALFIHFYPTCSKCCMQFCESRGCCALHNKCCVQHVLHMDQHITVYLRLKCLTW